jgi:hypothetical protein
MDTRYAAEPALGAMVRARENAAGDPGLVSSGRGDAGGRSYGLYQFKSRRDEGAARSVVEDFIDKSGYGAWFEGLEVNSGRFVARFQALARSDPKFVAAQHDYARRQYYDPAVARLARAGVDVADRGRGVQELIFSTANQYGAAGAARVVQRALEGRAPERMSDAELIAAIADYKHRTTPSWFKSSPTQWKGIRNRFAAEREEALRMTREGQGRA